MSLDYIKVKIVCPICLGNGYELYEAEDGKEYARKCKCRLIEEARSRFIKSGLASSFANKSFEQFETYGNSVLIDAKETAERFVNQFREGAPEVSPSLLLCGQVGAGKTHLGTACSMKLLEQDIAVIYMGYREEVTSLKTKIIDEEAYTRVVDKFKKAEVLFIDDFLKGKINETDVNIVYEIINYRYNNKLPTIISTEKALEGLIAFDEAIGSRIIEMCCGYIVSFSGGEFNYRIYRGGAFNVCLQG